MGEKGAGLGKDHETGLELRSRKAQLCYVLERCPKGYQLFNVSLTDSVDDDTQKLGSSKPQITEISYLWL